RDGSSSDSVVRVQDTGTGIAPNMLPNVFDMFTQAQESIEKSRGGLGIGLTLVKRLVEMHGGTIEARSEGLDKGSEFIVRLPALVARAPELAREPSEPPSGVAHLRILVGDDHWDVAE